MNDLAIREAYDKWAGDLVRFATVLVGPADAADVVADSFVELVEHSAAWESAERPRSFLFGVVANRAKMRLRSKVRRDARERWFVSTAVRPSDASAAGPTGDPAAARRLLGHLSTQQRTFVYLAYWEDWTADEIAAYAEVSEGAVRKQLARARSKIREELS